MKTKNRLFIIDTQVKVICNVLKRKKKKEKSEVVQENFKEKVKLNLLLNTGIEITTSML